MSTAIIATTFIKDPINDGALTASPIAATAYTLDVAWGPSGSAAVSSATLACVGATIDTSYTHPYAGHRVTSGRATGFDLGWTPNGKQVYLTTAQAGLGFWRITFPSTGGYTLDFGALGTVAVTVSSSPPAPTTPTWTVLHPNPMNRQPSKIGTVSFSGTYPSGGIDMTEAQIGLYGVLFADFNPVPPLQFSWAGEKLHVYNASGEVSGSVTFSTKALFIGVGI